MPPRLRVCADPGCPTLTPSTRCPPHQADTPRRQAQHRRASGDQAMDIYSSRSWRDTRYRFLHRNPYCDLCGSKATVADHVTPRRLLVAAGIKAPDHPRWLQPLCKACHDTKTATTDRPMLAAWRAGTPVADLASTEHPFDPGG